MTRWSTEELITRHESLVARYNLDPLVAAVILLAIVVAEGRNKGCHEDQLPLL